VTLPAGHPAPVHFDHAVAADLAARLDELAGGLEALGAREAEAAAVAAHHWAGVSRRWFDAERDQLRGQLRTAVGRARADADAVRRSAFAAVALAERRTLEARLAAEREVARLAALAD
jgi:hypothetical protein